MDTSNTATAKRPDLFERVNDFFTPRELDGKRDRSYLLWSFVIPFVLMLLIYVFDGVWPFGARSVLVLDLNGQYIGFYEALRAWVWGDGSLLYSFARTLGGEMMGIYAYYLASPLSYIVALFPAAYITEALLFIFLLKAGLSGLTFGIYLHRHRYAAPLETVAFSTLYALTSFAVVMQHNSMWIDNLILLPLVTLGVEEVVRYRRYRLFVLSLAMALLSNFYIGYMTCLYVLLYFFYDALAFRGNHENNPLGERQHFWRSLLRMGLYSLLAIGIAAIILLTALYSLSFGKTTFTTPDYIPYFRFDLLSFFSKLMPGSYDTVMPEGLPTVFTGTLTLLLVPLYFLNPRFRPKERAASLLFVLVFYLSMSISTLDMIWHGGQLPNWLNYRYSFMLSFFLLVLSARAFARMRDHTPRRILSVAVVLGALIALAASMGYSHFQAGTVAFAAVALLLFTLILLGCRYWWGQLRAFSTLLLLGAVITETLLNGHIQLQSLHMDVGATRRNSYYAYQKSTGAVLDWVTEYDTSFYRMETTYHRTTNDVMEIGYRGLSNSTSTLNEHTISFLGSLGMLSTSHWSEYKGSTAVLDSLLGIRYVVTAEGAQPFFAYREIKQLLNHSVWENPYALPLAYAVDGALRGYTADAYRDPLARQNALLSAMTGTDTSIFTPVNPDSISCERMTEGVIFVEETQENYYEYLSDVYLENRNAIENGTVKLADLAAPESSITYHVTVPRDGRMYFYVPTDYTNEVTIYLDGHYLDTLFGNEGDYLKDIGTFEAGTELTLSLKLEKSVYFYYPYDVDLFYLEDAGAVGTAMSSLAEGGLVLSEFTEDSFLGHVTMPEGRTTLLTTIPYDAGWHVTVDGLPAATYEAAGALLALELSAGTHTVEMVYRPDAYTIGRAVSIASVLLFLALVLLEECWRRGRLPVREGGTCDRLLSLFMSRMPRPEEKNPLSDEVIEPAYQKRLALSEQRRKKAASPTDAENAATAQEDTERADEEAGTAKEEPVPPTGEERGAQDAK